MPSVLPSLCIFWLLVLLLRVHGGMTLGGRRFQRRHRSCPLQPCQSLCSSNSASSADTLETVTFWRTYHAFPLKTPISMMLRLDTCGTLLHVSHHYLRYSAILFHLSVICDLVSTLAMNIGLTVSHAPRKIDSPSMLLNIMSKLDWNLNLSQGCTRRAAEYFEGGIVVYGCLTGT